MRVRRAGAANEFNRSGAHFIWVGLSTPKQEAVMTALQPRLKQGVLLGVGAAQCRSGERLVLPCAVLEASTDDANRWAALAQSNIRFEPR